LDEAGISVAPPKRKRFTAIGLANSALILFVITGALIVWTPIFLLCIPLWALPAGLSAVALGRLIWDYKDGLRPTRRATAFVVAIALLLVTHVCVGGSSSWLRIGLALRLWQVGGIGRVEEWVRTQIDPLRLEWDAMGGEKGLAKLSHEEHVRFLLRPKDSPEWLRPLRSYLPARISHDANGPNGITFELSGWDHGWGLTVLCEPTPVSLIQHGPRRLTDRSYIWGTP
jgi:hypothetical protein